jgi:hypothetical protein
MKLPSAVPNYELQLSTGKHVAYRPFLVREEKNLLIAMQDGKDESVAHAIKDLLNVCTFDKIDINNLPLVDVEWLFLNIRNKSMGEGMDVIIKCNECENMIDTTFDLSEVKTIKGSPVDNPVKISDNMWVKLRYPTYGDADKITGEMGIEEIFNIIVSCIEEVVHGDKVYVMTDEPRSDVEEFVNTMTQQQLEKLNVFFESVPKLVYETKIKCGKCGHDNDIHVEGLQSFFG